MLMPKRTKYRRPHILKYEGHSKGGNEVSFGEWGLQATSGAWISDRQIEAARIAITRYTKRGGKRKRMNGCFWKNFYSYSGKSRRRRSRSGWRSAAAAQRDLRTSARSRRSRSTA